jgi:hypothetical protein
MIKNNFLKKLPIELMREHIMPFTYNPQPEFLVRDIRDFTSFRCEIYELYKTLYPDYENPRDIMDWVSNDISRFNNQDIPLMYGFSDKHYEYWRRLPYLQDKSESFIYDTTMGLQKTYDVFACVNILIGLLRREERESLIDFIHHIYHI